MFVTLYINPFHTDIFTKISKAIENMSDYADNYCFLDLFEPYVCCNVNSRKMDSVCKGLTLILTKTRDTDLRQGV